MREIVCADCENVICKISYEAFELRLVILRNERMTSSLSCFLRRTNYLYTNFVDGTESAEIYHLQSWHCSERTAALETYCYIV